MAAMAEYGVPEEVLSDNGKQFTGRFGAPRPAEVLFERICRHKRHHPTADQTPVSHHDGEGGALASEHPGGGVDRALDLYGCAGGELRPGRSGRRRAGGPGALGAEPGEVDAGQPGGQGL
jgi:hypothetical protein